METKADKTCRVDLHVHSRHSDKSFSWFMQAFDCAECYTPVQQVYDAAMNRGMDLVTICDHDKIDGALELVERYDNAFISEEVSAVFPEDGCVIHTIALNISEAQHVEIQRLRRDVYDLVQYFAQENITYYWCHPLYSVNHRLEQSHVERAMLMFTALEARNGSRDASHEQGVRALAQHITPNILETWSKRHRHVPVINASGQYAFTGGSDDHGGLGIARAYTQFAGDPSAEGLEAAFRNRTIEAGGRTATATTVAHNAIGVVSGLLRESGQLGAVAGSRSGNGRGTPAPVSSSLLGMIGRYKTYFDESAPADFSLSEALANGHRDAAQRAMHDTMQATMIKGWRHGCETLAASLGQGQLAEACDNVGDLLKALVLDLPYLLSTHHHTFDRGKARARAAQFPFMPALTPEKTRVAIFTDTADQVDGLSLGLKSLVNKAQQAGYDVKLVAPGDGEKVFVDSAGIVRIPTIYRHAFPEYPDYEWCVPHLPAIARYLDEAKISLVQCSTPGPVGVAAMIASRLSRVPVIGQYHTDLPEYVARLTRDPNAGAIAKVLVGLFYKSLDRVLVPSQATAACVQALGVPSEKVFSIPRGIDVRRFHPACADPNLFASYDVPPGPTLLYVGRISREKGLDRLLDAFAILRERLPGAQLVMVGEGPQRQTLMAQTRGQNVAFIGEITGDALPKLYASCDAFVSPSETETFGNTVIEALASGVPVVVSNQGAASEHVNHMKTGFVVQTSHAHEFSDAMLMLLCSEDARREMGANAVAVARARYDIDASMRGTLKQYADVLGLSQLDSLPAPAAPLLRQAQ